MNKNFKAYVVREDKNGFFTGQIETKKFDELASNEITINVKYSSLNYKDALSAIGNKGVTKKYPHTPGIDAAGIVVSSNNEKFSINDQVIVTGYDLGMNTSGGFSEYIRVPSDWVIKLPESISLRYAMAIGTAGLTAGLCIDLLEKNNGIKNKQAIVTGSTGGVGSVAIQLLSNLGAEITAVTGKNESREFLNNLGVQTIISREELLGKFRQPLSTGIYDIGIDVVGGEILSGLLTCLKRDGVIACCGNVGGANFNTSVFPFILRGNRLLGVDSAERSLNQKESLWKKLSSDWMLDDIDKFTRTISLNDLELEIRKIYEGKQTGRVIISIDE
tara:strand:+ start:9423 stop:10418 length:996 start_codon:yes stop_codon:yes gene_type:complete